MSIILFFIVLLLLVLVHEFGHFIVAKKFGIRVDEFAFGFPPRFFAKRVGETTYSFNALPFGGYVKIYGEDPSEVSGTDRSQSFVGKPRWVQGSVIVAGVLFNILLAWLLISATLIAGVAAADDPQSNYRVVQPRLTIMGVHEGSPAELAGLSAGDQLIALTDGYDTIVADSPDTVSTFVAPREGRPLTITYRRLGEELQTTVTPISGIIPEAAAIGISMDMVGTLRLPPHLAFWEGAKRTWAYTELTVKGIYGFLAQAVLGRSDFSEVTGPVGIVRAVGDAAESGFTYLLLFTALISINLAVINLIPFPALDGGRLLFIVIEGIMRRPIPTQVTNWSNLVGFVFLMLLMVLVTYHDIIRLVD